MLNNTILQISITIHVIFKFFRSAGKRYTDILSAYLKLGDKNMFDAAFVFLCNGKRIKQLFGGYNIIVQEIIIF